MALQVAGCIEGVVSGQRGTDVEEAWSFPRRNPAGAADRAAELDALAARVARSDKAAFESVYYLLVDELYVYVRSQAGGGDVDDVVATVFLKMWQYARSYRQGSGSYRRWVYGIARNEVRNHWRRQSRTEELREDLQIAEAGPEPSDWSDLKGVVQSNLARLTPEQREVIVLRYYAGKTPPEIAEIMGKREGSIRALQHRALRQLRKAVLRAAT